ncbi:hypothetical protein TBR22_A35790 [Luteitalea sp. TBR-22]|uniref:hypothetical protein n=1 Tax=Luteitalea sp. TBR-22 TaxID=2802971 RepID=UPI001AF89301|nr:hypothetical protein [Luteitalea sp. TBR-22]BCS34349.1 hypothetical protein TBR22_A35790 [Luteitalea sp. TBR-22]
MKAAQRVLAGAAGLALLVVLAIGNAAGYRFGVSDQAFYLPSIFLAGDPTLYPRDAALLQAQGRLMVSDEITAWLLTRGVPLEPLMLAGHLAGLALLFGAVWVIGRRLAHSPWTAAACCAAVTLRHRITDTGANTFEGYYHPRGLAFAAGAWAAAALASGRVVTSWGLVAVALVLHPTTGLWWAVWLAVASLMARPTWRRDLGLAAACAVLVAGAVLLGTPLGERLRVMDPAWVTPFASKDYVFPDAWGADAWLANLGTVAVVLLAWRWRTTRGIAQRWEAGMAGGVAALAALFLASLPLIAARVALAVQMQTSRVFWVIDMFAVLLLVWALAEAGSTPGPADESPARTWRPRIVALLLLAIAAARGLYITQVQHPERAFVQRGLEDSDWVRVGQWIAEHTPADTQVLTDPDHDWKFGHSVRLTARRDVFVEGVKDAALAMYDREVAVRVQERLEAIGDIGSLDADKARALATRYDLDVLVIDRDLPLPELHRDGRFRVYRLR